MTDAYGTIVLSNQSKADPKILLAKLNRYLWNAEFNPIEYKDGRFYIPGIIQYPTIFPAQKVIYDEEEKMIEQSDPIYDEPIGPDWDIGAGADVNPADLIKDIGSVLLEGEIHIVTSASYNDFSIKSHHLVIRSDQTGTLATIEGSSQYEGCGFRVEHYS